AVRLVYADWLEEHGQPERAEFIRAQVELARENDEDGAALVADKIDLADIPPEVDLEKAAGVEVARRLRLKARVHALQEELFDLDPELPAGEGLWWADEPRRGFQERLSASSGAVFLQHAKKVFELAPVRSACIDPLEEEDARALAASPFLDQL